MIRVSGVAFPWGVEMIMALHFSQVHHFCSQHMPYCSSTCEYVHVQS